MRAPVEIYNSTISKHDLKHFSKSDILGFASAVSMECFLPGGRLNHDDYNVEQFTNILMSLKFPTHNSSFAPGFTNKALKYDISRQRKIRDLSSSSKNFERDTYKGGGAL